MRTYVQLARTGDILGLLPLLWSDAQKGQRSRLMVAKEYASLLEGVSYVEPVIFEGEPHEIGSAVEQAKGLGGEVTATQVNGPLEAVREHVYGPAVMQTARTTSFQKEQWRVAGRLGEWDSMPPLVFDRRDAEREKALLKSVMPRKGKPLLVHADGISSPFPHKELLFELVSHTGHPVIDLCQVKAERFYDLLALYEQAFCLVAIDSAPLQLANACRKLPVIALTQDRPLLWNGSSWRPNHEFYCRYHDFPDRAAEMMRAIRSLGKPVFYGDAVQLWNAKSAPSQVTSWRILPVRPGMCSRLGPVADPKVPHLKDCIRMGIQKAGDGLLLLTREDTQFPTGIAGVIVVHPCFAYRVVKNLSWRETAPVVDMFCATAKFWRELLPDLPDLLYGNDYYWSHALWELFKQKGATDITGAVAREPSPSKNGSLSEATTHNAALCDAFITNRKVTSRYPKVSDQIETVPIDRAALNGFGYNPSIIDHNGVMIMAYRYHPTASAMTKVAIYASGVSQTIDAGVGSIEDPKLFHKGSDLCLSFVSSDFPNKPPHSVVRYGRFPEGRLTDIIQPRLGVNDGTAMEKNWVFFAMADSIYCLYQCQPVHRVVRLEGPECSQPMDTIAPRWYWGTIKGGTPPVDYDGAWLRFFHSTLDNEWAGSQRRRYFMGAYTMSKVPPFGVIKVSSKPILYGSEIDDLRVKERPHHWKSNVVFPGGAVARDDGWIVSVGVNDSSCVLSKVKPKDLRL